MINIEDTLKELEKELKQVKKGLKKIQSLRAELVGAVEITQRKGLPTAEIKIMQWEEDAERITFHKVQTDELTCIQTIDPPKTDLFGRNIEGLCCADALDIRCIHQSSIPAHPTVTPVGPCPAWCKANPYCIHF
jgi:hypothetical protein